MMNEQVKEITGFFCRWLLLGGVVCSIFVLARASLATAREIPAHRGVQLVVSDEMHRGLGLGEMLVVNAYLSPPEWVRTRFQFIAATHGGRPMRVLSYGSRITARLPQTWHGLDSLEFKGHPYGSFAFERSGGIYRTVSPGAKVFAIDASLAANSSKRELQECMGVLRGLGDVVFIAETDLDEYTRIRPILRREFPDIPQICKVRAPHWKRGGSFDKLQHDLKARSLGLLSVITADRELAERALSVNALVHWIDTPAGQDESDFAQRRSVRRHDSLAALGNSLAGH